jgi:hypothetical protein
MRTPKFIIASLFLLPAVLTCIPIPSIPSYTPYDPTKPTSMEGFWKQTQAHYQYTGDATHPAKDTTFAVGTTMFDSQAMATVEIYTEIANDSLAGFEYYQGDSVYYTVTKHLTPGPDANTLTVPQDSMTAILDSTGTHVTTTYQFQNSHLVRTSVVQCSKGDCSGGVTTVTTTFDYMAPGMFPPQGWPSRIVEVR